MPSKPAHNPRVPSHDPRRERRRRRRRPALVTALLTITATLPSSAVPASAVAACRYQYVVPSPRNVVKVSAATRCLINRERTRRGRAALVRSGELRKAARRHARRMVRRRFFAHVSPDGSTLLSRVTGGTSYLSDTRGFALAENLNWGVSQRATPRQIVRGWMRSSAHRRNVLDRRYRHIGIGVVPGAPTPVRGRAATYTTVFGKRF